MHELAAEAVGVDEPPLIPEPTVAVVGGAPEPVETAAEMAFNSALFALVEEPDDDFFG